MWKRFIKVAGSIALCLRCGWVLWQWDPVDVVDTAHLLVGQEEGGTLDAAKSRSLTNLPSLLGSIFECLYHLLLMLSDCESIPYVSSGWIIPSTDQSPLLTDTPRVCFIDLDISQSQTLTMRLVSMELGDTNITQETWFQKWAWDGKHTNPFGLTLLCWFWLLLYLLKFQMSPNGFTKHGLMRQYQVFPIVPSTLAFWPIVYSSNNSCVFLFSHY